MDMTFVIILVIVAIAVALVIAFLMFGQGDNRFTFDIGGAAPRAAGGAGDTSDTAFHTRLSGLQVFSGTVIGALLARLWSMQLVSADSYNKQAESNRTRTISTEAPRGRILDRNGVELVTNRPMLTVVAKPAVADDALACQLLGNLIGMPAQAVRRKVQDTSAGAQSDRTVAADVSRRVVAFIQERPYLFSNVEVVERNARMYPKGSLAAHVLGYTGAISADQLEAQKDSKDAEGGSLDYQLGDTVGQSGVEARYESVLQGVRGEQTVYVDADGNVLDYASSIEPQAGSDIALTIDAKVQEAAEQSLAKTIKKIQETSYPDCKGGSVVCLDVTNGEVIAMASAPTYEPNLFVGGISNADWEELSDEKSGYPLLNRVISGQYPSASTIKPLSTLAALDHDLATSKSTYDCEGTWYGFGKGYAQKCWNKSGHGILDLRNGIVFSCDVVFYEIGKAFFYSNDKEGMQETFRRWGLGSTEGIDLPSEEAGRVPDAEWKENYYSSAPKENRQWQGGDNTNLAIGQGDLLVTPLQMACVYMGLANSGTIYKPHVLKSVLSHEGTGTVMDFQPTENREVDEKGEYFDLIHDALKGVIYEESEAQASHFTNMKETVAGKTGTAESSKGHPHGWFIAYVPYEKPKYVVAANIEYGGFGARTALYVVRDVLGAIYGEPDDSTVEAKGDR